MTKAQHIERVARVVAMIIAVVLVLVAVRGQQRCDARGGQYVRGLFWMECIRR